MFSQLERRVRATIESYAMLAAGRRIGVAVSGGADSVALLRLLASLRDSLGIQLAVLHYHHGLRGADADADERFVAALSRELGIEFLAGRGDVAGEAGRAGLNLEDAARRMRYAFFAQAADARRLSRVAVAHTVDDQAETLVARLARGTGPTGLAGIYPVVGLVIRPLLEARRAELRAYLSALGQSWREDVTNRDTSRLRAHIRADLMPRLESGLSPKIVEHLAELARLSREDEAFWTALVEERFRGIVHSSGKGFEVGAAALLAPLHDWLGGAADFREDAERALSRRLIRRLVRAAAAEMGQEPRQLTARHVESVLRLARGAASGRRIPLPGGVLVERSLDRIRFTLVRTGESDESPPTARSYSYSVRLPERGETSVDLPEIRRRIRLKVVDWPHRARETRIAEEALDIDRLRPPLVVRNWRPGDAFRPRGRGRVHKLKRLFSEGRIVGWRRPGWPVLESDGRIVWTSGWPAAEEAAAGSGTRAAVVVTEEAL